jgi:hypothetical protein
MKLLAWVHQFVFRIHYDGHGIVHGVVGDRATGIKVFCSPCDTFTLIATSVSDGEICKSHSLLLTVNCSQWIVDFAF